MKFSCNTKDLTAAVASAARVVHPTTTIPILANLLLTAAGNRLTVRSTDLEITVEHFIEADVTEEGSATIPAKPLAAYLGNTPAGPIEVHGTPTKVGFHYNRSQYDFHALPPDEYPALPAQQKGATFTVSGKVFKDSANGVTFAASGDEARGAVLMGTLTEIKGKEMTMVATDGYRLGRFDSTLIGDGPEGEPRRFIIPSHALGEVAKSLGASENVQVAILGQIGNQLSFVGDKSSITVRLVDGQYPRYESVIPSTFESYAVASVQNLTACLKRAKVIIDERSSGLKVSIADKKLVVEAVSDTYGTAREEIDVEHNGNPVTWQVNAAYLIEILSHLPSTHGLLEFSSPLTPISIRPYGDNAVPNQQQYILMPMRP